MRGQISTLPLCQRNGADSSPPARGGGDGARTARYIPPMAAPENPVEPFKRALAHAARALAELPDLEVTFGAEGPRVSGH